MPARTRLRVTRPFVSALCRGRNFAPRLQVGDTAVYVTTKGRWLGHREPHWRLVAVLRVRERFESHQEAARWYEAQGLPLPSNCWVDGNPPIPYERTVQDSPWETWDRGYRARARRFPVFLATEALFLDLWLPPILSPSMMVEIFGRVPLTRNPPRIPDEAVRRLLDLAAAAA